MKYKLMYFTICIEIGVFFQHEAVHYGHTQIAKMLIDHGALINVPGTDNDTPLHDALRQGKLDCVRLLVSHGACITSRQLTQKVENTVKRQIVKQETWGLHYLVVKLTFNFKLSKLLCPFISCFSFHFRYNNKKKIDDSWFRDLTEIFI